MTREHIRALLFERQDTEYRAFQCALIPTVEPERVIGVRTPALRTLAKELCGTAQEREFRSDLPHVYYEENNLHALFLERERDEERLMQELDCFLPCVDNWATCDMLAPRLFRTRPQGLIDKVKVWLRSEHLYTVRFAMGVLMRFYLKEGYVPEYSDWVAQVDSQEYYVRMMAAWYFATALTIRWEDALPYLTENRMDVWTHNKAIQKAVESLRITGPQKQYLKTLRRKEGKNR